MAIKLTVTIKHRPFDEAFVDTVFSIANRYLVVDAFEDPTKVVFIFDSEKKCNNFCDEVAELAKMIKFTEFSVDVGVK